jgi:hypothetical protein
MIAMAVMFFAGDKGYLSFAIATITVVGIAMLGSSTRPPLEARRPDQQRVASHSCIAFGTTQAAAASGGRS